MLTGLELTSDQLLGLLDTDICDLLDKLTPLFWSFEAVSVFSRVILVPFVMWLSGLNQQNKFNFHVLCARGIE